MYTILVNETNELITSVRERIMQRSKLVDNLHFLVDPAYKGIDMSDFTVMLEYILPVSKEYKSEILSKSDNLYKEKLEYKLPFDTNLTREAGDVQIQLTFTKLTLNADGNNVQQVRKTSPTVITILPISAWSDIIADSALTALDQRIIQTQAMINQINEVHQYLDDTKADNIVFDKDTNTLQLTARGNAIGNKITLNGISDSIIAIHIDNDGNLIVVYVDGRQEIVGKVSGECAGIYVPSMEEDVMTFTLSDKATDPVLSFDLDKSNNWSEIEDGIIVSNHVWKEL